MKIRHKYLEEINATYDYDLGHNFHGWNRKRKYMKDFKKTGVNPMECWALDNTFYCWLYEHLRKYLDEAGKHVDLEYHKFKYKDKDYTQLELINILIDDLHKILTTEFITKKDYKLKEDLKNRIFNIWKLIIDAMWW